MSIKGKNYLSGLFRLYYPRTGSYDWTALIRVLNFTALESFVYMDYDACYI